MARHRVVHSEDAATIVIEGDRRRPEPTYAIIKFPGGDVEVSRCTDGSYWVHIRRILPGGHEPAGTISESRLDYERHPLLSGAPQTIESEDLLEHLALRVRVAR